MCSVNQFCKILQQLTYYYWQSHTLQFKIQINFGFGNYIKISNGVSQNFVTSSKAVEASPNNQFSSIFVNQSDKIEVSKQLCNFSLEKYSRYSNVALDVLGYFQWHLFSFVIGISFCEGTISRKVNSPIVKHRNPYDFNVETTAVTPRHFGLKTSSRCQKLIIFYWWRDTYS